ncbi:MAG: type II toxin-antitoxin system Phd/YefM family antitoxin [Actinomycetes bacterium]
MVHLRPSADVRPVAELRSHASAVIEQMQESKRPVILTQHGRSAAVLLDVAFYEALIDEVALVRDVRTAEEPVDEAVACIAADDPAAALPRSLDQASVDVLVQDA